MRKNRNQENILTAYSEMDPEIERLIWEHDDEPGNDNEPPAGFEDMLYEEWRDRQYEAELEIREKARKMTRNGAE